jgi:hypothetical protein
MRKYVFVSMFAFLLVSFLFIPVNATSETEFIEAAMDNTLIEDPNGARSNGSGPFIFAGLTSDNEGGGIRRALIFFDVAAKIPEEAIVESVFLTLHLSKGGGDVSYMRLHRVLEEWGEGASSSTGGRGAPSKPDDATWLHTFYPDEYWGRDGGRFIGRVSASQAVDERGFYTWGNTPALMKDVQMWVDKPEKNFGWILIGDEDSPQSVRGFDSRESTDTTPAGVPLNPLLEVTYTLP